MPFHNRFNEKEANPNSYFQFVRVLKDLPWADDALDLLRALAAQVKPICKKHGFGVNSFEEYEWNREFAGRNWNAGEVIEIVLRRPDGAFAPTSWLIHVVCHELAHIKHMNHGPGFQKLNAQLRQEVRDLQRKGYYGDGLWSNGKRLNDGAAVQGDGIQQGVDVPEYLCGGAGQKRTGGKKRRYRRRHTTSASNTAGSAKRRKPGGRVRRKDAFTGDGATLDNDPAKSTFRRRAQSKSAVEARALAAEKRQRHADRRARGEPSETEMSDEEEEDELMSEEEVKTTPKGKGKGKAKEVPLFRSDDEEDDDEGSGGDDEPAVQIDLTEEERRWLKSEAAGALRLDDYFKPSESKVSTSTPSGSNSSKTPTSKPPKSGDKPLWGSTYTATPEAITSKGKVPSGIATNGKILGGGSSIGKSAGTSNGKDSRGNTSKKRPIQVIDLNSDSDAIDDDDDLPDAVDAAAPRRRPAPNNASKPPAPRAQPVAGSSKSANAEWACTACTLLNDPERTRCRVCEQARD